VLTRSVLSLLVIGLDTYGAGWEVGNTDCADGSDEGGKDDGLHFGKSYSNGRRRCLMEKSVVEEDDNMKMELDERLESRDTAE